MRRRADIRFLQGYFNVLGRLMVLTSAVLLSAVVNPAAARADCSVGGNIPFTVSASFTNSKWCFQCMGPWLRNSGVLFLNEERNDCEFYSADKTLFSPYGEWTCAVIEWGASAAICSLQDVDGVTTIISEKNLCLSSSDSSADFTINPDGTFTTNLSSGNCTEAAVSFLGDNPNKRKRDIDEFSFSGSQGDEVFVRLETDPSAGNNSGEAILSISGNSLSETVSGPLPLEITAILPASGDHTVTVAQPKRSSIQGQQFKGTYILSVSPSPGGGVPAIIPEASTEK